MKKTVALFLIFASVLSGAFAHDLFIGPSLEYRPFSCNLFDESSLNNSDNYNIGIETTLENRFFATDINSNLYEFTDTAFNLENSFYFNLVLPLSHFCSYSMGLGVQTNLEKALPNSGNIVFTLAGVSPKYIISSATERPEILLSIIRFRFSSRWHLTENDEFTINYIVCPNRIGKRIIGGTFMNILESGIFSIAYKQKLKSE